MPIKYLSLLFFFLTIQTDRSFAQQHKAEQHNTAAAHVYYINISGLKTREDVVKLQDSISQKKEVTFFMGRKYPVIYFILKSVNEITQQEFTHWVDTTLYKIVYFGEGDYGKEKATMIGRGIKIQ